MTSQQEVIAALARAGRIPEPVAAAALAIEETAEFRRMWLPCLNGELHPASVALARAALGTVPGADR
jgi:hypothetical protein